VVYGVVGDGRTEDFPVRNLFSGSIFFSWYISIFSIFLFLFGGFLFSITQAFLKAWTDIFRRDRFATILISADKTFLLNPLTFNGPCNSSQVHFQVILKSILEIIYGITFVTN
jgi:hypothetical protein